MKRRKRAQGFTLIEVLITMTIVAILVNIAIPAYQSLRLRARGAAVVGDINVIETAAFDFFARTGSFPPSAFGSVPSGMAESLPNGFSFSDGETRLRHRSLRSFDSLASQLEWSTWSLLSHWRLVHPSRRPPPLYSAF